MKHYDIELKSLREWRDENLAQGRSCMLYISVEWSLVDYMLRKIDSLTEAVRDFESRAEAQAMREKFDRQR